MSYPKDLVARVWAVLEAHDVVTLVVTGAAAEGGPLLVYLHGNAGILQQEDAIRALSDLAEVERVEVSELTWSILRVHLRPGH